MAVPIVAPPSTWASARRKSDGKPFFYIPGTKPGAVYMTAHDGCTCPAAQHSKSGDCKHQRAVRDFIGAPLEQPRAPKSRYELLFPGCRDCGDVADALDGYCDRCASDRDWQAQRDARGA